MLPTFNRAEVSNEQEVKGLRASYVRMERGRTDRNWTTVRRRARQDPVASSDPIPGHVGLRAQPVLIREPQAVDLPERGSHREEVNRQPSAARQIGVVYILQGSE